MVVARRGAPEARVASARREKGTGNESARREQRRLGWSGERGRPDGGGGPRARRAPLPVSAVEGAARVFRARGRGRVANGARAALRHLEPVRGGRLCAHRHGLRARSRGGGRARAGRAAHHRRARRGVGPAHASPPQEAPRRAASPGPRGRARPLRDDGRGSGEPRLLAGPRRPPPVLRRGRARFGSLRRRARRHPATRDRRDGDRAGRAGAGARRHRELPLRRPSPGRLSRRSGLPSREPRDPHAPRGPRRASAPRAALGVVRARRRGGRAGDRRRLPLLARRVPRPARRRFFPRPDRRARVRARPRPALRAPAPALGRQGLLPRGGF